MRAASLHSFAAALAILGSVPAVAIGQDGELRLASGTLKVRFQGSQIIGRAAACSLNLKGVPESQYIQLSRLHAALLTEAGKWSITDLGSTNGTFVNGQGVKAWSSAPLADGDRVGLAGFTFTFRLPSDKASAHVARFDAERPEEECSAGSASDCAVLAVAYHVGIGVRKDPARARTLFQQACRGGYEPACRAPASR
jgi:TPR repeat protein